MSPVKQPVDGKCAQLGGGDTGQGSPKATEGRPQNRGYDDLSHPPVTVTYLEVTPSAGGPAQVIAPPGGLDLGSTGRIAVSAWQLDPDPTGAR